MVGIAAELTIDETRVLWFCHAVAIFFLHWTLQLSRMHDTSADLPTRCSRCCSHLSVHQQRLTPERYPAPERLLSTPCLELSITAHKKYWATELLVLSRLWCPMRGGGAENDGHENNGPSTLQSMKLQDIKMQDMKLQDMTRIDSILFNFSFFSCILMLTLQQLNCVT